MQALHPPPTESSARQSGRMEIFTMGTNSEFCSDERVGYTLLKSFLAGEVASYVWDYLDRQGR